VFGVGRHGPYYYYTCTRQNREKGRYSCQAPRIPAEPLENALIERIRELGRVMEARDRIVQRALECLDTESVRLREEEEVLRRQLGKTRTDIGRLVEVLKSLGTKGLVSVQDELTRLEAEEKQLAKQLSENAKRQAPVERITDEARKFVETWQDVGELLDAATWQERLQILQHYIEVVELGFTDPSGQSGTYALRLFPEVRPDRGFDWDESGENDANPSSEMTNGDAPIAGSIPVVLTPGDSVRISLQKAPRGVHYQNRGFVELGAFAVKRLRRVPVITFHAWNAPPPIQPNRNRTKKPVPDPIRLARYYQSLLDTGKFESRAALSRFLGVSRARVTQVLKRLEPPSDDVHVSQRRAI
jgi:biotin operon repressor